MHKELVARGILVGKERVRLVMQRHGIKAKGKKRFVVTTDSKHELAEHVLLTTAEPMHQVADQGAYVVWLRQPGAQLAESESG
jgi:hypothetical protein